MSGRRSAKNSKNSKADPPTKGQRRDGMARKREERAARQAHKKQRQAQAYLADDENLASFKIQLAKMGLELRDIPGDGNCLFRALGDQMDGHSRNHMKHRRDIVEYMLEHRADFEPFVEDDISFEKHTKNLINIGTYAGNDAIVAFARLHVLHVVIHQINSPCWQIHGTDNPKVTKELHISYHNGDHYSSIRKLGDQTENPANIKMTNIKKPSPPTNGWENNDYTTDFYTNGDFAEDYLENPRVPNVQGEEPGTAKAITSEGDMLETIMRMTGCEDQDLVQQTLESVGHDMESAIDLVFEFMSSSPCQNPEAAESCSSSGSGLWTENGTGARIFGGDSNGAKPKLKQQSTSQRQRTKKLEKKERATERRRQNRLHGDGGSPGGAGVCTGAHGGGGLSSDEDVHLVVDKMGTVKI